MSNIQNIKSMIKSLQEFTLTSTPQNYGPHTKHDQNNNITWVIDNSQGLQDFIHWIPILNTTVGCFKKMRFFKMSVRNNWLVVNLPPVLRWRKWQTMVSHMHPVLSHGGTIPMHGLVKATEIHLTWIPRIVWQKRESTANIMSCIGTYAYKPSYYRFSKQIGPCGPSHIYRSRTRKTNLDQKRRLRFPWMTSSYWKQE